MTISESLTLAGSALLSLGGGALIVAALSKWLGGVWASRILEDERAQHTREHELLVRRRNVYSTLATSLRVLLRRNKGSHAPDGEAKFLAAYDEASVWAPDLVMNKIGELLDLLTANNAQPGSVPTDSLKAAFAACIEAMRRDAGFPQSTFRYRVVSF